jgi:type VI protein secretion system component VasF
MNQSNQSGDQRFERETQRLFTQSVAALDGQTRSRLAQARTKAIAARRRPAWSMPGRLVLPAAAAAVTAALLVWQMLPPAATDPAVAELADLEILFGEDDLELIEELEFYAWIDEQPEFAGLPEDDGSG